MVHLEGERVVNIPVYREIGRLNCAQFARKLARDFFGKHFDQKLDYSLIPHGLGYFDGVAGFYKPGLRFPDAWDYRNLYQHLEIPNGSQDEIANFLNEK